MDKITHLVELINFYLRIFLFLYLSYSETPFQSLDLCAFLLEQHISIVLPGVSFLRPSFVGYPLSYSRSENHET